MTTKAEALATCMKALDELDEGTRHQVLRGILAMYPLPPPARPDAPPMHLPTSRGGRVARPGVAPDGTGPGVDPWPNAPSVAVHYDANK